MSPNIFYPFVLAFVLIATSGIKAEPFDKSKASPNISAATNAARMAIVGILAIYDDSNEKNREKIVTQMSNILMMYFLQTHRFNDRRDKHLEKILFEAFSVFNESKNVEGVSVLNAELLDLKRLSFPKTFSFRMTDGIRKETSFSSYEEFAAAVDDMNSFYDGL